MSQARPLGFRVKRMRKTKKINDATDIQLSSHSVCLIAKCTVEHTNKLSTKLSYLRGGGGNEGYDHLIQITMDIHNPYSKDMRVSRFTCPDTGPSNYLPNLFIFWFYNSIVSKPLYSLFSDFVTENG